MAPANAGRILFRGIDESLCGCKLYVINVAVHWLGCSSLVFRLLLCFGDGFDLTGEVENEKSYGERKGKSAASFPLER